MKSVELDSDGSHTPHPVQRVLLIEDDLEMADEICGELQDHGYEVRHAASGLDGAAQAESGLSDLLIVDRMLPGLDGLAVIKRVRERKLQTPVLVLSALGDVNERVRGLKAGGDDYLTKPFALSELMARVEALLRRPIETRATELHVGSLSVDLIEQSVRRHGRPIELLGREFKLLLYFMRRPGQVITRGMLLEDIWNCHFLPQSNPIDVHIGKLRRKLDGPGESPLIQSVRGQGFVLLRDA
jgi:two-component system, OmpR family, response regulator